MRKSTERTYPSFPQNRIKNIGPSFYEEKVRVKLEGLLLFECDDYSCRTGKCLTYCQCRINHIIILIFYFDL